MRNEPLGADFRVSFRWLMPFLKRPQFFQNLILEIFISRIGFGNCDQDSRAYRHKCINEICNTRYIVCIDTRGKVRAPTIRRRRSCRRGHLARANEQRHGQIRWADPLIRSLSQEFGNPSAVFRNRPLGTAAADRCPHDFEFSAPSLAAALGWTLTLRFLCFLLFQGFEDRAGQALILRQRA
jgi:hypothetical protein